MKYGLYGLMFVVFCNLVLFLFQANLDATALANGVPAVTLYQFGGSIFSTVNVGNASAGNYQLTDNVSLPGSAGAVEETNGNFFVDAITSTKNFFGDIWNYATLPFKWSAALVTSIPTTFNILSTFGVPSFITFGLSAVWYLIMFFIVVMIIMGR